MAITVFFILRFSGNHVFTPRTIQTDISPLWILHQARLMQGFGFSSAWPCVKSCKVVVVWVKVCIKIMFGLGTRIKLEKCLRAPTKSNLLNMWPVNGTRDKQSEAMIFVSAPIFTWVGGFLTKRYELCILFCICTYLLLSFFTFSNCLLFLCRLTINQMMKWQIHLELGVATNNNCLPIEYNYTYLHWTTSYMN